MAYVEGLEEKRIERSRADSCGAHFLGTKRETPDHLSAKLTNDYLNKVETLKLHLSKVPRTT